jgi:hypothetical protein
LEAVLPVRIDTLANLFAQKKGSHKGVGQEILIVSLARKNSVAMSPLKVSVDRCGFPPAIIAAGFRYQERIG